MQDAMLACATAYLALGEPDLPPVPFFRGWAASQSLTTTPDEVGAFVDVLIAQYEQGEN